MTAFSTAPPSIPDVLVEFRQPHILLVTLNRPKQLNAIRRATHRQLHGLWSWYDAQPSLRCAVLIGAAAAFCVGADLKEWNSINHGSKASDNESLHDGGGFGGLSNRRGKKPIIAAVNGLCLGGGMEMVLNADMVIASKEAKFGLPEVSRGVVPIQGALPRLMRTLGMQRASEMALLGRTYGPNQMLQWGLVNAVVAPDDVLKTALRWAAELCDKSPDSVIVAREGLLGGWASESPRASTARVVAGIYREMEGGDNMKEGVLSFVENRKPVWKDSKL